MYVIKHVSLLNPGAMYQLIGINLETGNPQAASDEFWQAVVGQLRLTPKQVDDACAAFELYTYQASKVLAERQELHNRLMGRPSDAPAHDTANSVAGLAGSSPRCSSLDGPVCRLEVLEALARNLKKEHSMRLMLNCFFYNRVLTGLQLSQAAVFSFPLFPDVYAMMCVIAEDGAARSPAGQRRLVFAHHAQELRDAASSAARARAARLAGGGGSGSGGSGSFAGSLGSGSFGAAAGVAAAAAAASLEAGIKHEMEQL
ncbi:hypothetical protein MNEG_9005 [Monoraphidium neglectum]|uniref:Uncharacterized protein n=1 Tax=Monoraphidium neglectum TaxID=145388 RepID=A0A0D2MDX3_9CHLO|nr:hypothetical protein MNEG_9005 [Monoraphidium neglectum]KIY98956.1 hypothetical protein MNEG_9005 [Monoraphidium neglectum]|eukprot:XP_013897976.1 hypothetical protein MNEG_9005 [Monoraphidium neglectum]